MDADPHLARRNIVLGLTLFGIFWLIFAGTVVVALIYVAVEN